MYNKEVSRGRNQQSSFASGIFKTKAIRLTVPVLAIAGWLATIVPTTAVTASYANDYRVCAARLKSVGITPQVLSQPCATALHPRELSSCVVTIDKQTQIGAVDALSACGKARRPQELATCVVGISNNTQEAVNPAVLNYCGRSLLPVRFAQCVVGLRSEIDVAPAQILDTCIDGSDSVSGFPPSSAPPTKLPTEFKPTFETNPTPANPVSK
jgi:hypothetical protein